MSREIGSLVEKLREIHDWINELGEDQGGGYYTYPAAELDAKLIELAGLIKEVPETIDPASISQIKNAINNTVGRHGTLQGPWINSLLRPLRYVLKRLESGGDETKRSTTATRTAVADATDAIVTLDQAAAIAGLSKRTLERHVDRPNGLPPPDFRGGGGRAHKWRWSNLRGPLETVAGVTLPEQFPGHRII